MYLLEVFENHNAACIDTGDGIKLIARKEDGAIILENLTNPLEIIKNLNPEILTYSNWLPYLQDAENKELDRKDAIKILNKGGTIYTVDGYPVKMAKVVEHTTWMGASYKKDLDPFQNYYAEKPKVYQQGE